MSHDCFGCDFNDAGGEVFVCVRVLANEYSRRANLNAMVARANVVQTGNSVRCARTDLAKSEYAPLRVTKRCKIAARNSDLVRNGKRHSDYAVVYGSCWFGFFNVLGMRDGCNQKRHN